MSTRYIYFVFSRTRLRHHCHIECNSHLKPFSMTISIGSHVLRLWSTGQLRKSDFLSQHCLVSEVCYLQLSFTYLRTKYSLSLFTYNFSAPLDSRLGTVHDHVPLSALSTSPVTSPLMFTVVFNYYSLFQPLHQPPSFVYHLGSLKEQITLRQMVKDITHNL